MTPEYPYFVVFFTFISETLHIMLDAVLELLEVLWAASITIRTIFFPLEH